MKRGGFISRRSSFVRVKAELEKRTEKIAVTSRPLSTNRLKLGKHFVQDDVLKSVAPIRRELDRVGASSYAPNELIAESRASAAYATVMLSSGADAA
ncbi:unnamed protein product, partial [Ascophyllum nodosum]